MRRIAPLFLFSVIALSAISTAHAQWGGGTLRQRFGLDWRRNLAWPEPFAAPDRETVRTPFKTQIAKGWMLEATLTNNHFDPKTNELNSAGVAKVKWLVRLPDANRRAVYILRGDDNAATSARFYSTNAAVGKFALQGSQPPVMVSDLAPRGWPAEGVDTIQQQFQASQPPPTLNGGGGGGGGGAGTP